jgi:hypothetical protein
MRVALCHLRNSLTASPTGWGLPDGYHSEKEIKMARWIAALGCAMVLALAMPLGNEAVADGHGGHGYGHKLCFASKRFAPQTTWVCPMSRQCCYDWLRRRGSCIPLSARCF